LEKLKSHWRELAGAVVVLVSRLMTLPRTPWESDEFQFMEAVRDFDPSRYHPHPPGYPLFVGLGKLVNLLLDDPFRSLVTVSVVSCVVGFLAFAATFRQFLADRDLAVSGALLFYFSAGMLVHSPLALADSATLMFLGLAFYAASRFPVEPTERRAIAVGLWFSAAIGCRPQIAIAVLPALAMTLILIRSWRMRALATIAFTIASLMWFVPLMDAAGGWDGLVAYEVKQAAYFAAHDASQSRGTVGAGAIVARFLAHPWGSKYVTLPLFFCMALGLPGFVRRFRAALLPFLVFCIVHLAFALAAMDPADGVRYSLPAMTLFALIAACGFEVLQRTTQVSQAPWLATLFLAAVSWWYVRAIVGPRAHGPSPVVAAANYARAHFAPGTVILYQLGLRPQTEYLLSRFPNTAVEKGLGAYVDRPDVPVVLFADGGSKSAEGQVFAWPVSDAYGKLTRNVFRQVTLDPVRPEERYEVIRGVYALERTVEGTEWRWLTQDAELRLPHAHGPAATLRFSLSHDAPFDTNRVRILVNGIEAGSAVVSRDAVAAVTVPLPPMPDVHLRLLSDHAFSPAQVLGNRDPRTLAVQLAAVD